nr:TonB-dependent receptor plug domain-containing protein [Allomuricauda sp.]
MEMKKLVRVLLVLAFLPMVQIGSGQEVQHSGLDKNSVWSEPLESLSLHNAQHPIEKVYLHLDKTIVSAAENIWFSAYVVLGAEHYYSTASKVLHVDLIGPKNEIILSNTFKLETGRGQGSIAIPKNLPQGKYQLRAYTQWMRNFDQDFFFKTTISVLGKPSSSSKLAHTDQKMDLQFFPEGGHLVNGLNSKVAFRAVGPDGKEKDVQGIVKDSNGQVMARLDTISRGSGIFYLRPNSSETYTAFLEDGTSYQLPKVHPEGYNLSIGRMDPDKMAVQISATERFVNRPFYVLGLMRGKRYFQKELEFDGKSTLTIDIPTSEIPSGILTLTLFDEQWNAHCERLVFLNNLEYLSIDANLQTPELEKRGEVILDIEITDLFGDPVSSEFSIAVTDADQLTKDTFAPNMLTHLLLQSDLRGNISRPADLFKDLDRTTIYELDLVMLTHGWRAYNWQQIWERQIPERKFSFSQGMELEGIAYGKNKSLLRNTNFRVIAKTDTELAEYSFVTDNFGRFTLRDFNLAGEVDLVFNAYNAKNKLQYAKVSLKEKEVQLPEPNFQWVEIRESEPKASYVEFASLRRRTDSIFTLEGIINLENVDVSSNKIQQRKRETPSNYGIEPDKVVYADDFPSSLNLIDLINRMPNINFSRPSISEVRGGPLWIVDGFPMQRFGLRDSIPGGNIQEIVGGVPRAIGHIDVQSVERVEYLKPSSASIYGVRGSNGVFLIYTKTGVSAYNKPLSSSLRAKGHTLGKEFYSPKYDGEFSQKLVNDYRAMLYWNPRVITDANGKATLRFFNSDFASKLQVQVEALSEEGLPGTLLQTFGNGDFD